MNKQPLKITHKLKGQEPLELELRVDVLCMRRLRRYENPIDILKVVDKENPEDGLWARMIDDPGIAFDIAYEATRHDPKAVGMSATDFTRGLIGETPEESGDAIEELTKKVLEAVVRFTPNRQNRAVLQAILTKTEAAIDKIQGEAEKMLESGEIDKMIDAEVRKITPKTASAAFSEAQQTSTPTSSSEGSSTSSGNSESTPARSTGASKKAKPKGATPSQS